MVEPLGGGAVAAALAVEEFAEAGTFCPVDPDDLVEKMDARFWATEETTPSPT
ncbi:MAG TPA: hypothetical protein VGL58_12075 [Caulobacteraceae bacterium]